VADVFDCLYQAFIELHLIKTRASRGGLVARDCKYSGRNRRATFEPAGRNAVEEDLAGHIVRQRHVPQAAE